MLRTIGLNALIGLALSVPIIWWASPLPASAVSLIYIIAVSITGIIMQLFKKKKNDRATILLVMLSLSISGCVSTKKGGMVVGRSFLGEKVNPNTNFGAYGYLLIANRYESDSKEHEKMTLIANLFKNSFEEQQRYINKRVNLRGIMAFYWFLSDTTNYHHSTPTAEEMIANYDYTRAKIILSQIGKAGSKGPVFIAWNKPYSNTVKQRESLIFDISNFDSTDIKRAYSIWTERVSMSPDKWKNGFAMETLRSEFRNFLNTYSDCLAKLMTIAN